jgi:hypothetical protein
MPVVILFSVLGTLVTLGVMFRLGPLAVVAMCFAQFVLGASPITLDMTAWYFGRTAFATLVLVAVGVYGFLVSLAGRPAFGLADLDSIPEWRDRPRRT